MGSWAYDLLTLLHKLKLMSLPRERRYYAQKVKVNTLLTILSDADDISVTAPSIN